MTFQLSFDIVGKQILLGGNFLEGIITKIAAGSIAEKLELMAGDKIKVYFLTNLDPLIL